MGIPQGLSPFLRRNGPEHQRSNRKLGAGERKWEKIILSTNGLTAKINQPYLSLELDNRRVAESFAIVLGVEIVGDDITMTRCRFAVTTERLTSELFDVFIKFFG